MSANDLTLIIEMLPEYFNVYHSDMDEYLETSRRGRAIARRLSLKAATQFAQQVGAEYSHTVFLTAEQRRLLA